MMDLLLKLLGVWREQAGHIVDVRPTYHGDVPAWLVFLVAVGLVGITFWLYRRTAQYITPGRRYTLAALRAGFLCLLLLLTLHPVLSITVAGAMRQTMVVLIDTSGSMGLEELRSEAADQQRAAIAQGQLEPTKGLKQEFKARPQERTPRLELARAALKNPKLDLVNRLENTYELAPMTFDRTVRDIPVARPTQKEQSTAGQAGWSFAVVIALLAVVGGAVLAALLNPRAVGMTVAGAGVLVLAVSVIALVYLERAKKQVPPEAARDRLEWVGKIPKADGSATALGDTLRDAIYRKRGQDLAGVLLITDGGHNAGANPLKAAELAKAEGLPLYIYGVGITQPKDVIVSSVFAPDLTFVRDEVPVAVRVSAQGMKGQSGKLVLRLGDKQVDEKEVALEDGEQTVNLKFTPGEVGDFALTASIDPRPEELIRENNTARAQVRVVDGRIKVLQIEQLPRWEFKYIQAMLLRDRRVEYKCVLLDADPQVTEVPNTPYLKQLPVKVGELAAYDLVIVGDVDPRRVSPAFITSLSEFVSRAGGSLMMVAGKRFAPVAYRKTAIEKMLPVEFDAATIDRFRATADKPIRLEITDAGKAANMLRLADKDTDSAQRWKELPPVYWTARVARPKPAAEVLVVDGDPSKSSRYGKMPVIALQQYGLGHVLYVGTDNTWRWRKNMFEQDHTRLWGQMIERMAMPHLLGAAKRTQLSTDKQVYAAGDRVTVFARLYKDKDFEPVTEPAVKAFYAPRDAAAAASEGQREVVLRPLPDQPGMYRGEFVSSAPGNFRLHVETDASTATDFSVSNQTLELTQTALNEPLLREMAAQSGGGFFREEDLHGLPAKIEKLAQVKRTTFEVEFAFTPLYFMLLLGLVTAEWIVRKLCQLK